MFSQHVSCWCDRASPRLCDPLRLCPAWAHSALFLTRCLLCFSLLEFWGFLTSGSHTKPPRETQLKPPGFTCFHNKTRRGAEFVLGRFGDLWRSFHSISCGCKPSGCLSYLLAPIHLCPSAKCGVLGCWDTEMWLPSSLWRNSCPCAEATSAACDVFSSLL